MRKRFEHDPDAVLRARLAAGLTQAALAEAVGCAASLISEMENGTRNSGRPRLVRMARVLKVKVADLEPRRSPAAPADGAVPEVRDTERADTSNVPELRSLTTEQAGGRR